MKTWAPICKGRKVGLITASSPEKLSIFNLNFKSWLGSLIKKQSRESSENEIALSRKCLGPIKYPKIFIDFLAELNYSKKRIFGKISVCPIKACPTNNKEPFIWGCGIEEQDPATAAALVIGSLVGSRGLAGGDNLGKLLHQKVVLEAALPSTDSTSHHHPSPTLRNSVWVRLPSPSMSIILKSCSACLQAFSSVPPLRASYSTTVCLFQLNTISPVSVELS